MADALEKTLSVLAERTSEHREDLRQSNKQRRNQVVDIYGYEYQRDGTSNKPAMFYISVSPDMVYLERFQCKIAILADTMPSNLHVSIEGIDVTEYLIAQQDGDWITTCDGAFYPSNKLTGDDDPDDTYDFLEVAGTMYAEERDDEANKLVRPGFKRVEISGEGNFTAIWISYLKYSHLNR